MCFPVRNFESPQDPPSQCLQEAWCSASSCHHSIHIILYFWVPLPSLCPSCLAKVYKALQWSGKVELRSMCSRVRQTWVQISHLLCSNERLPRRFWKASLFQACPLLNPFVTRILTGMGWLCLFTVSTYFCPLAASFCPEVESKAARRHLILLPHLWCLAASWHSRLL